MVWVWHTLSVEPLLGAASTCSDYCREKVSHVQHCAPSPSLWTRVHHSGTDSDGCEQLYLLKHIHFRQAPRHFLVVTITLHQMRHNFQFYQRGKIEPIWWLLSDFWHWRVLKCLRLAKHWKNTHNMSPKWVQSQRLFLLMGVIQEAGAFFILYQHFSIWCSFIPMKGDKLEWNNIITWSESSGI